MPTMDNVLQHPEASLPRHPGLSIATLASPPDALEFHLVDALSDTWVADVTVTSIENGSIVFHCPGEFRIKAASITFEGPDGLNPPLPALPESARKIVTIRTSPSARSITTARIFGTRQLP